MNKKLLQWLCYAIFWVAIYTWITGSIFMGIVGYFAMLGVCFAGMIGLKLVR